MVGEAPTNAVTVRQPQEIFLDRLVSFCAEIPVSRQKTVQSDYLHKRYTKTCQKEEDHPKS